MISLQKSEIIFLSNMFINKFNELKILGGATLVCALIGKNDTLIFIAILVKFHIY